VFFVDERVASRDRALDSGAQYYKFRMKKNELAMLLAKENKIPESAAADELDRVVHDILRRLRKGQRVSVPGLGIFKPGKTQAFRLEKSLEK
jgi:nucleoid DNA-binding protein